jgi:hypothetical protein
MALDMRTIPKIRKKTMNKRHASVDGVSTPYLQDNEQLN